MSLTPIDPSILEVITLDEMESLNIRVMGSLDLMATEFLSKLPQLREVKLLDTRPEVLPELRDLPPVTS